jgi:hypothetical protein
MTEAALMDGHGASLSSEHVPRETIASEVARAAKGMTNTALARSANISPRTLRAILDGHSSRRFGRATLDKLDGPLGWRDGRAWTIYSAQFEHDDDGTLDRDKLNSIATQMRMLSERMDQFDDAAPWAADLIGFCRGLSPEDRATVISLARRLAGG